MRIDDSLNRRQLLVGLSAYALASSVGVNSWAGAAKPISLVELVRQSSAILVGTPQSASSEWEGDDKSRRIVTYSDVEIVQSIDGRPTGDSRVVVRTLGGTVGDIGQIVHGEASLALHRPQVLFLHQTERSAFVVTAMAQGHYRLDDDEEGTPRLQPGPRLADFVSDDPFCAVARLRGRTVNACEQLVAEALNNAH